MSQSTTQGAEISFSVKHSRCEPRTLKLPRDADGRLPTGQELLTGLLEYLGLEEPEIDEPGPDGAAKAPKRNQDTTWMLRNATQGSEVPLDSEVSISQGDLLELHDRSIAGATGAGCSGR